MYPEGWITARLSFLRNERTIFGLKFEVFHTRQFQDRANGAIGAEFRSIFTFTASVFAPVLKEKRNALPIIITAEAVGETANDDSSAALAITTTGGLRTLKSFCLYVTFKIILRVGFHRHQLRDIDRIDVVNEPGKTLSDFGFQYDPGRHQFLSAFESLIVTCQPKTAPRPWARLFSNPPSSI